MTRPSDLDAAVSQLMAPARTNGVVSSDQEAFDLPKLRMSFGLEVSGFPNKSGDSLNANAVGVVVGYTVPGGSGGFCTW